MLIKRNEVKPEVDRGDLRALIALRLAAWAKRTDAMVDGRDQLMIDERRCVSS